MIYRISLGFFLFGLVTRSLLLYLNLSILDLDPYWSWQARAGLILVLSDFGMVPLGAAFETLYHMTIGEALQGWPLMDRGIVYVHFLIKSIFGTTSYGFLQALHVFIDALLIFPLISIAYTLSQNKRMTCLVGLIYSIFLPQLWLSVQPDYNVWLTTGYVLSTWLFLKITSFLYDQKPWPSLALHAVALFVVLLIVTQMRSTIVLLPIGMFAWWWATTLFMTRTWVFPRRNWMPAFALLCVGFMVIGVSGALNQVTRGEASPVRSTFGHAFWTGVGQYENPHDLSDSDASVSGFYKRETGKTDVNGTTGGGDYNTWLTNRAVLFIEKNPFLYASMVIRRAISIVFPNMPVTLIADKPAYDRTTIELIRIENRIKLQKEYGIIAPTTISVLIVEDPFYVVGLIGRLILMLILPLGVMLFLILSERRALGLLALVPLVYHVITLSPIYVTPIIMIPAYAAILPVICIGWCLAIQKSLRVLRGFHY